MNLLRPSYTLLQVEKGIGSDLESAVIFHIIRV
jgi:hypothetical protein